VGAVVGATGGAASGATSATRIIGGALGGLAGAALGNWICSPSAKDSSFNRAAQYGSEGRGLVARGDSKVPLSISEDDRLDAMSKSAVSAKTAWKRSLYDIQTGGAGVSAREKEANARRDFENKRANFATTVARLNAGTESTPPKQVGRYLEISSALLELDTESRTNYSTLADRDQSLMNRNQSYSQEVQAAASTRVSRY
jgi:hypothetical protein